MPIKKEITNTECSLWKINKNINPITKRKISSTSPIYKKFEKVCGNSNKTNNDDIYKIVNDFCSSIKKLSNEKRNINDNEIYEKINNLCSYKKEENSIKFSTCSLGFINKNLFISFFSISNRLFFISLKENVVEGYIFSKKSLNKYNVYLPKLKCYHSFSTIEEIELYTKCIFKIIIFEDEDKLNKRIRLSLIN